jgi:hypothetical protein
MASLPAQGCTPSSRLVRPASAARTKTLASDAEILGIKQRVTRSGARVSLPAHRRRWTVTSAYGDPGQPAGAFDGNRSSRSNHPKVFT